MGGDRVVIGQNYVFVVSMGVKGESGEQMIRNGKVTYEGVKAELHEKQGDISHKSEVELQRDREREQEFERRLAETNAAVLKAQQEADELIKQREAQFQT